VASEFQRFLGTFVRHEEAFCADAGKTMSLVLRVAALSATRSRNT